MAETFKLIEENTGREIDLVASASQTDIKTLRQRIQAFESDVLMHKPDDGHDVPVRLKDPPIEGFFELLIPVSPGSAWDTPQDTITQLKRWVDGADQQAFKAYSYDEGNRIKLKGALSGQDDYAYHTVMWGFVDDSEAYYNAASNRNFQANPVTVYLKLEPVGIGDPILLRNDLPSSPHFIEDSNSDGLADGWLLSSTSLTPTLNTSFWVIGGQSQKLTGAISNMKSGTVLCDAGYGIMAQVWGYASDTDNGSIMIYDGSDTVAATPSKGTNSTDADATFTDLHDNTWYRATIFGVNAAANAYLRLNVNSTTNSTYFDGARMHILSDYLANCGFETAGAGGADVFASWTESASDGAIARDTTPNTGTYGAKLTAGASVNTQVYQAFTCAPGRNYTLRFWTRGDATYAGQYAIYDVTNAKNIVGVTTTGITAATYAEFTKTFTAPPGCTSVRPYLRCPSTSGGIAYFDDVIVHPTGIENGWISSSVLFNRCDTGRTLVSNPGFETAGGGGADIWANWTENAGDGALANETTIKHGGSDAAKLTAGASVGTYLSQAITVIPGRSYMLDLWTRSTTGDGASRYGIYDNTNAADIVATASTGVTGETYTKFQKRFTAPASCVAITIFLRCSATNTDVVYFDDVQVYDESAINYIDTWGLPGDMDALVTHKVSQVTAATTALMLASWMRSKENLLPFQPHFYDSADRQDTSTNWATITDTSYLGNSYEKYTEDASPADGYLYWRFTGDDAYELFSIPWRVFVIAKKNAGSATITGGCYETTDITQSNNFMTGSAKSINTDLGFVDLGLLNATGVVPQYRPDTSKPTVEIFCTLGGTANTNEISIDGLLLLPSADEFILWDAANATLGATEGLWLNGPSKTVVVEDEALNSRHLGGLWYKSAGNNVSRTVFAFASASSGDIIIAVQQFVTVEAYPRTRHLLNPGVTHS